MNHEKKGVTCTCGKYHEFNGYVYAHWNTLLSLTCDRCGRCWRLQRGSVVGCEQEKEEEAKKAAEEAATK